MLLLDSILAAPGKAVVALFQELAKKAQEEFLDDDVVKKELQEIYALVEGGRISDTEFESRENLLLARLEEIARVKFGIGAAQAALSAGDGPVVEDVMGEEPAIFEASEPGLIVQQGVVVRALTTPPAIIESPLRLPDGRSGQAVVEAPVASRADATGWRQEPPRLELLPWSAVEAAAPFDSRTEETLAQGRQVAAPPPVAAPPQVAPMIAAPAPATLSVATADLAPFFAAPGPATPAVAAPPPAPVFAAPPQVAPAFIAPSPAPAPFDSRSAEPLAQGRPAVARLTIPQVVEAALGGLSILKLKVSSVTLVNRAGDGWQVVVEVLERRGVPDTSDLLGVYEVHLDEAGGILRYERTRIRRRCDLGG